MQSHRFDLEEFFALVVASGARALLIGRQALIALGLPLATNDYGLWCHIDDIEKLNAALTPSGVVPSRTPQEARVRGRYVLENDQRIDVLVARAVSTTSGGVIAFEDAWPARQSIPLPGGERVDIPSLAVQRPVDRPVDPDRNLSPEEFQAWIDAPWAPGELEEIHDLIDWFTRRYPTVLERLEAGRRAYDNAMLLRDAGRRAGLQAWVPEGTGGEEQGGGDAE